MRIYQIGFDFTFLIFWHAVSPEKFGVRVAPLLLQSGQMEGIKPAELLPIFNDDFILRDGRTLYRSIPKGA